MKDAPVEDRYILRLHWFSHRGRRKDGEVTILVKGAGLDQAIHNLRLRQHSHRLDTQWSEQVLLEVILQRKTRTALDKEAGPVN